MMIDKKEVIKILAFNTFIQIIYCYNLEKKIKLGYYI